MKIVFADSFFKSLRRMRRREMFHWRVWNFIRYELLRGLKNFWFFRKQIWSFRPWDYTYQLDLLKRSLEPLGDCIEKGMEIDFYFGKYHQRPIHRSGGKGKGN
jgi:hypothetical protein